MLSILKGLILCFIVNEGVHGYQDQYGRAVLTSPCHVIDPVVNNDFPSNKIGKNKWINGCPTGRYLKAVWAGLATEHFQKMKCCTGASDNSLSWELRDLSFFSGGKSNVTDQWNIQCQNNAVITGLRYFTNPNGLRHLSAVRCSALKYQIADQNQCTVLNFTESATTSLQRLTYNKKWQHECPDGYAITGLYDDNGFKNIKFAKCCKLIDVAFKPGWTSNFEENFSNLTQSTEDSGNFRVGPNSCAETPTQFLPLPVPQYKLYRLMSPAFDAGTFCLRLKYVKFRSPLKIMVKLVTADSVEILNNDGFMEPNLVTFKKEVFYVKAPKIGQIFFEVQGGKGYFYLLEIKVDDVKACQNASQCIPAKQDCPQNEVCLTTGGFEKCICDTNRGFYRDQQGRCIKRQTVLSTQTPTDGSGKSGGEGGWATVTRSTVTLTPPTVPNIESDKIESATPPWMYVVAGASSIVVIFLIVIGCFLGYQRTNSYKRRRHRRKFEPPQFNLSPLNALDTDSHTRLTHQCSMSSVTYETDGEPPRFRPFMNNLGYVESAAASAAGNAVRFLGTSPDSIGCLDITTGDPIYTKINRGNTIEEDNRCSTIEEQDENANHQPSMHQHYQPQQQSRPPPILTRQKPLDVDDEEIFRLDVDNRRPSTLTLHYPDYGESSDDEDTDSGGERFLVPGDDEADLLAELNELTPDSVRISKKILGQGAFGLVKLGEFYSTHGIAKVAVKILKQRADLQITQSDRVKFYQEAHIMSQFDHENVITLFGVLVENKPCMVIEHMERGNLWKYLNMIRRARQRESVNEISRQLHGLFLKMARDIVSGMTYLASLEFVHRDLATRNILLDSRMRCKISDFGLSRHFMKDDHYYTSQGGQIPVKWTAPEALQFKKYSSMSDVWSYGIVLWEIWSLGKRPYGEWDNNRVLKEVCDNNYRLSSPDQTPVLIYRIMMDCWKNDKNERPNFNKIEFCLQHNDDRILGRRKKVERTRSITFSIESEFSCDSSGDENNDEPHCRTE